MMTSIKTSIFMSDPALRARLLAGEHVGASTVADEELSFEIGEGGGEIWYCGFCQAVHSPNRPGACDTDDLDPVGYDAEVAHETQDWSSEDIVLAEKAPVQGRARRGGHVYSVCKYDGPLAKRFLKRKASKARRAAFRRNGEDANPATPTKGYWY